MNRTIGAIRTAAARLTARLAERPARRRAVGIGSAALATVVTLSLAAAGGTNASWIGSVSVQAPSIRSGSITALLQGFTGLTTTFSGDSLTKTSYLTVGNSGDQTAQFAVSLGLAAGSSAAMAGTTTATFWATTDPASCTETASPASWAYGPVPWNAIPVLSGSLPAKSGGTYCVRTRTAAANLATSASITPQATVSLSLPGTGWTSTATASATQSTVADSTLLGSDYTDAVRSDGAQHYWRLGEASGSVLYDLIGSNDAYAGSGLTRSVTGALAGDANRATSFAGDASSHAITRQSIAGPNSFALEAWFQTTSTSGGKIIGFGDGVAGLSGNYDRHVYLDGEGRVIFGVWPGWSSIVSTGTGFNDGEWHHVVANLSTVGQALYVDGELVGTTDINWGWPYNGYWHIGGDSPWSGDAYFDGVIDDVAVYPAPLSSVAVGNHYNLSGRGDYPAQVGDPYASRIYADAPTLYWRLGESSGTTATDSSPAGHLPGTYQGGVTTAVAGAVTGTRNTAAAFNGTDAIVSTTTPVTGPDTYSLELWFSTTSTAGGKLIGFGNASSGISSVYDRHVYMSDDGRLTFGTWVGYSEVVTSDQPYNDGAWHHLVATQSGAGMVLYVDGQQVGHNPNVSAEPGSGYWRIGGDNHGSWPNPPSSNHLDGTLDEVAVYSTALGADQVTEHYAVGSGAPVARFTSSVAGMTASVDAAESFDLNGSVTGYSWSWGDGTEAGSGATTQHSYAAPGPYTVTLTVTDDSGRTSTRTDTVTVADVTAPSVPGTPTVDSNTGGTLGLTWPESTDDVAVSGYVVYRDGVEVGTAPANSFVDTGLSPGTSYSYTVLAKDGSGNTSDSSPALAATTLGFDASVWQLIHANEKLCVTGSSGAAGAHLVQDLCDPASTFQHFRLIQETGSWFRVEMRYDTGLVWDVWGESTAAGGIVTTYPVHHGLNQQWGVTELGDGTYSFVARQSGLCLASPDDSQWATLVQQPCDPSSPEQQFTVEVAP